jgi:peptidoglycan/LPS O-acetylase OafA/YrhL
MFYFFSQSLIQAFENLEMWRKSLKFFTEDSQANSSTRFKFLDGYRGFCALLVVMNHMVHFTPLKNDYQIFYENGFYVGLVGFFILSSFLLTYKMINDFYKLRDQKAYMKLKCSIIIVKNYLTRRFFRIYMPYLIFVSAVKFGKK